MHSQLFVRLTFVLLSCMFLPRLALAAGVQNLRAAEQNGQMHIQWDPPASGSIAAYNVYFSGRSILRNNGEYDDYEKTVGTRTSFILTSYPKSTGSLYVAVLPVDEHGKEMDTFTDEVRVALGADSAAVQPTQADGAPRIVFVQPLSATGVVVAFDRPITLSAADAPRAFEIDDGSGTTVRIKRLILQGAEVRIETDPLLPGTTYRILLQAVTSADGSATSTPTFYTFTTTGTRPTPAVPAPPPPSSATSLPETTGTLEVGNVELRAERQQDGRYLVLAAWEAPQGTFVSYVVRKIRNGQPEGSPETQPFSAVFARFANVAGGQRFGVTIQTVAPSGALSAGTSAFIDLAAAPPPPPPAPTTGDRLSASGISVLGVMAASGALAGWRRSRKKKA